MVVLGSLAIVNQWPSSLTHRPYLSLDDFLKGDSDNFGFLQQQQFFDCYLQEVFEN
jgi:hypothetical protein